jgi:hypothetical protein
VSRGDNARGIIRYLGANNYKLDKFYLIDLPDAAKPTKYHFNTEFLSKRREVQVIDRPSHVAAAQISSESLDLVFLDADHTDRAFVPDIKLWMARLCRHGTLVGDEWDAPATHSCAYRTPILKQMFTNISHEPENRISEGHQTSLWWVTKD